MFAQSVTRNVDKTKFQFQIFVIGKYIISRKFQDNNTRAANKKYCYIMLFISSFIPSHFRQAFSEAFDYVQASGGKVNRKDLDELLAKFRNQMRFQLACFRTEQTSPQSSSV